MRVECFKVESRPSLTRRLHEALERFRDLYPTDRKAAVLIKPNLNSNLDSLTGNTTDLRLLADVARYFKDAGYENITIGEGYNSGFHRDGISVIARNRVDRLARFFGVGVVDFNYAEGRPVSFEGGETALAARPCFEADLFVNLPKLKMHYETKMSVCLKSLIGTLVGRENKGLTHKSLVKNILRLNDAIRPHLHVVDALIAMEGTGPSAGTPLRMDTLVIGDDPYVVDLVCARLFACAFEEVPALAEAIRSGRVRDDMVEFANSVPLDGCVVRARRPHPNAIARLMTHPRYQRYFIAVRNSPVVKDVISDVRVKKVLLRLGLTQEVILKHERENELGWDGARCGKCGRCARYCPVGLDLPADLANPDRMKACIDCLYCFAVCPRSAIEACGDLGYYSEQVRRYGKRIREIA